jgi:hypothetical protein
MAALATSISNCKRQTRPFIPHQQIRKCLIEIWSWAPDGVSCLDRLDDWWFCCNIILSSTVLTRGPNQDRLCWRGPEEIYWNGMCWLEQQQFSFRVSEWQSEAGVADYHSRDFSCIVRRSYQATTSEEDIANWESLLIAVVMYRVSD